MEGSYPEVRLTEELRRELRDALERLGENQAWLAEKLGCSRAQVSQMLSLDPTNENRVDASTLVVPACILLGVSLPMLPLSPEQLGWLEIGDRARGKMTASQFEDWKRRVLAHLDGTLAFLPSDSNVQKHKGNG